MLRAVLVYVSSQKNIYYHLLLLLANMIKGFGVVTRKTGSYYDNWELIYGPGKKYALTQWRLWLLLVKPYQSQLEMKSDLLCKRQIKTKPGHQKNRGPEENKQQQNCRRKR